jgi:hypothetical protein
LSLGALNRFRGFPSHFWPATPVDRRSVLGRSMLLPG